MADRTKLQMNRRPVTNRLIRELDDRLRDNFSRVPEGIFGDDEAVARWLLAQIAGKMADTPKADKAGRAIRRDHFYYELSL